MQKLQNSVDLIAKTTATILENMATKKDLSMAEFRLQSQISNIETDLKSFKQEVRG